jgi:fucose permease
LTKTPQARRGLLIAIIFVTFMSLGLLEGLLGVAWPSIRRTFGLPLDALGALLAAFTIGYLLSSFNSGRISSRAGVGPFLVISNVVVGIGLLGYMIAPSWEVMVACGVLVGLGTGGTDSGLNAYLAVNHSTRVLNWSHASFGVGATVGPVIMATMLGLGYSWRYGYALAAMLKGLLAISFGLTLSWWKGLKPASQEGPLPERRATMVGTLRLPIVWLGMALFLLYTGLEITAGQWSYSLFTEARGVRPEVAGVWISIYWGSMTAGRLLIGFVSDRIGNANLVRAGMLGVLAGSILISMQGHIYLGFIGLALMGFSLAPVFPALVSGTPVRVGSLHVANAMGFQIGAAALGGAIVPGLTGVLAMDLGLEVIGPVLIVSAVATFVLHEVVVRRCAARQAMNLAR